MHEEQRRFTVIAKAIFPDYFRDCRVLDVGSADICGNNRFLFDRCKYTGLDIWKGPNVDVVCEAHKVKGLWNTVISTNCLEHDQYWKETVQNCVKITHEYGMFMFSCASEGFPEHGTTRTSPFASPHTNDYYRNLVESDIRPIVEYQMPFCLFMTNPISRDLYFIGFKHTPIYRPSIIRYIWVEVKYFFWLRVRDYKNAFRRLIKRKSRQN